MIYGGFQFDFKQPFRRFKGGGGAKMPAPQPAVPVVVQQDATTDAAIKKARNRSGYEKTIITGSLDSPKPTNKLTTLG